MLPENCNSHLLIFLALVQFMSDIYKIPFLGIQNFLDHFSRFPDFSLNLKELQTGPAKNHFNYIYPTHSLYKYYFKY